MQWSISASSSGSSVARNHLLPLPGPLLNSLSPNRRLFPAVWLPSTVWAPRALAIRTWLAGPQYLGAVTASGSTCSVGGRVQSGGHAHRGARRRGRSGRRAVRGDLLGMLDGELARRLEAIGPVALAPEAARVKLQTNDNELSPFGRGTVFPIPARIRFVRTATYWKTGPTGTNAWFDNGWNFCAEDWSPLGCCTWESRSDPGPPLSSLRAMR